MTLFENTIFYVKAKKMLDDYVARGGNIEDLSKDDKEYKYIKNSKAKSADGRLLTLEEKFEKLHHPRKPKQEKDVRQALVNDVEFYVSQGKSFHIARKKLPFYERLATYSRYLARNGEHKSHEQIMKYDLGYKNFSDDYYRCMELEKLKTYRDENGFIDGYRKDKRLVNYVRDVAIAYAVPYYIILCLVCDEKLNSYTIEVDKVKFTERLLTNYAKQFESFVGIKRNHPKVYNAFEYLTRYYSDGSECGFSKQEWLDIFGLGDVEHRFWDITRENTDIDQAIKNIKSQCKDGVVIAKDVDSKDYIKVVKKSVQMGISVSELLSMYGLKHKHLSSSRMARTEVDEIPYLSEMKQRRDELILTSGKTEENGCCKEEIFEAKLHASIQVYNEYKEKLLSYIPKEYSLFEDENVKTEKINASDN